MIFVHFFWFISQTFAKSQCGYILKFQTYSKRWFCVWRLWVIQLQRSGHWKGGREGEQMYQKLGQKLFRNLILHSTKYCSNCMGVLVQILYQGACTASACSTSAIKKQPSASRCDPRFIICSSCVCHFVVFVPSNPGCTAFWSHS
jgi:hypothetical protein